MKPLIVCRLGRVVALLACILFCPQIYAEDSTASGLVVIKADGAQELRAVSGSFLNRLVPKSIRQDTINVRVQNEGSTVATVNGFGLALKGKSTQRAITGDHANWIDGEASAGNVTVAPGAIHTLSYKLDLPRSLGADQFDGLLRVYLKDTDQSLDVPVTLFTRIGVFGAVLALVLGTLVGRVMKDMDQAEDQMILMGAYVPLRRRIDTLTNQGAKHALLREMQAVEAEINKVTDEQGRKLVAADIESITQKVVQLEEMDSLFEQTNRRADDFDSEQWERIKNKFDDLYALTVHGDSDQIRKGMEELKEEMKPAGRTRGGIFADEEKSPETEMDAELLQKFDQALETIYMPSPAMPAAELTLWDKFEKWLLGIVSFFAGIKVTAKIRYALFRPLLALITFAVLILLGFQEIYVNGGDTFGVNGLYDYLKLFLWGVLSDVFSRTLAGNPAVSKFTGMN